MPFEPPTTQWASRCKLSERQKRTLQAQGRCFRCQKKGHPSRNCISRKTASSGLSELPVELLEMICAFLVELDDFMISWMFRMSDLRLACRTINVKTYDFFARVAFRTVYVNLGYRELRRHGQISSTPALASKVERIMLSTYDKHSDWKSYTEYMDALLSDELSLEERRKAEIKMRLSRLEQCDKAFVERSATDAILLFSAFQKFPNLKIVLVPCSQEGDHRMSIRQKLGDQCPSTTKLFSMVLSSLAHAGAKPQELLTRHIDLYYDYEGVSLQALSMPHQVLSCLSELRRLNLWLETKGGSFKDPEVWHTLAATFLSHCPRLERLKLGFRNDWADTEAIFATIGTEVTLPVLKHMTLNGIRCAGADLDHFLQKHDSIETLRLQNLDIKGSLSYSDILAGIAKSHTQLGDFHSYQIAQNTMRLYFRTLACIGCSSTRRTFEEREDDFQDYEWVSYHKYTGEAGSCDRVQERIAQFAEDLAASDLDYHSDGDFGQYHWSQ